MKIYVELKEGLVAEVDAKINEADVLADLAAAGATLEEGIKVYNDCESYEVEAAFAEKWPEADKAISVPVRFGQVRFLQTSYPAESMKVTYTDLLKLVKASEEEIVLDSYQVWGMFRLHIENKLGI